MISFTHFTDPGHGWLRVDIQSAASVGLKPSDFTKYSYRYQHWLYLEEDVDATKFLRAYTIKHGWPPRVVTRRFEQDSAIRGYPRMYDEEK